MCAIGGMIRLNGKINMEILTNVFKNMRARGSDASGFAYIKDGEFVIIKKPITSEKMVETEEWKQVEKDNPQIIILHTRAKTQGSEHIWENNHPIYDNEDYALVHNGVIYNYSDFGVNSSTVDSMAILKAVEKYYNPKNPETIRDAVKSLMGGQAVLLLDKNNPHRLIAYRHTNPLVFFSPDGNDLYFASVSDYFPKKTTKETYLFLEKEKKEYYISELKNDECMVLEIKDKQIQYKQFPISTKPYTTKRFVYPYTYQNSFFNEEDDYQYDKDVVLICPHCGELQFRDHIQHVGYAQCVKCKRYFSINENCVLDYEFENLFNEAFKISERSILETYMIGGVYGS